MPTPADAPSPNHTAVYGNFFTPTYVSVNLPYIMFIPRDNPWHGRLFECFRWKRKDLRIHRAPTDGLWMLDPTLIQTWWTVEIQMRAVLSAMCDVGCFPYPEPIIPFGAPYRFGYHGRYRTREAAREVAWRSIHGFLPLLGNISLMFCYLKFFGQTHKPYDWCGKIVKKAQIEHQWLAELENSAAGDFTLPRIGGILDLTRPSKQITPFDHLVGLIVDNNLPIPLYIRWGAIETHPEATIPHSLERLMFFPDPREVRHLQGQPGSSAFSAWSVKGEGSSRQLFSCRSTAPQNNSIAVPSHPPPRNAARRLAIISIYFTARCLIVFRRDPAVSYDLWSEYSDQQCRYDDFSNEWDLCEAFGPNCEGDDADDEPFFANDDNDEPLVPSNLLPEDEPPVPVGINLSELEMARMYSYTHSVDDTGPVSYSAIGSTLSEMVLMRFGCTIPQQPVNGIPNMPPIVIVNKVLGSTASFASSGCESQVETIRVFLTHCLSVRSLEGIPFELLDYHQPTTELHSKWTVDVRREKMNGVWWYIISEQGRSGPLYIVVESAMTALEVVWQGWGPDLAQVAYQLLSRGIKFRLCSWRRYHPILRSISLFTMKALGYRPEGYTPNRHDYLSYVNLRDTFLQSPRGRAALSCGGIVGRLAREQVSNEAVFRGLSDDAALDGLFLWNGSSMEAYLDDELM
ncbi:hypothetical protein FB451DRAFT_1400916 [Mycena latifolia]|nr:hypothetical protein FB451DRAFT_1400916 [Mycena latifolia]